jgi:uroporphyrin-III C-methyltransferase
LIENASLPSERTMLTRLDLLGLAARTALGDGPALLLIGRAIAVASQSFSQREKDRQPWRASA